MFFRFYLKAFSLIELGFFLFIVGILATAAFKGTELLEQAKIHATVMEIHNLQTNVMLYRERYGALPGDDPNGNRFGLASGNGNYRVDPDESELFWEHLIKASITTHQSRSCRLGGVYHVVSTAPHKNWIQITSSSQTGVLTPKQALGLQTKLNGVYDIDILNDAAQSEPCISPEGIILQTHNKPSCIVRILLN